MSEDLQADLVHAQLGDVSRRLAELGREFDLLRDLLRQIIERLEKLEGKMP